MNDFDYDCMQKKRIASGAVHRKRGSKSKKCTLPSDYLTKKELKAMNGEVKSYNIHERMDWKKFKELDEDVAKAHINWLIETFGCNGAALAESLGVSKSCMFTWLKEHDMKLGYRRFMGSKEWLTFLGKMPVVEPEVVEEATEAVIVPAKVVGPVLGEEKAENHPVRFFGGRLVLAGPKAAVLEELFKALPDNVFVKVEYSPERNDNGHTQM